MNGTNAQNADESASPEVVEFDIATEDQLREAFVPSLDGHSIFIRNLICSVCSRVLVDMTVVYEFREKLNLICYSCFIASIGKATDSARKDRSS